LNNVLNTRAYTGLHNIDTVDAGAGRMYDYGKWLRKKPAREEKFSDALAAWVA